MRKLVLCCLLCVIGVFEICKIEKQEPEPDFYFGSSLITSNPSGRFVTADVIVSDDVDIEDPMLHDEILDLYLRMNGEPTTLTLRFYEKKSYPEGEPYLIKDLLFD